jgi:ATP-binding cassette, subfamily C, bacterial
MISAFLKAKWSYFTGKPTGMLISGVGGEANTAGAVYTMVSRLVSYVIQAIVFVGVAFVVSWKLAMISLVVSAVILISLQFLVDMAKRAGRRSLKRSRELVSRLSDAIIGLKPLKAMAREDEFARLFRKKVNEIRRASRRAIISTNVLSNMQEPLLTIMFAVGFYVLVQYMGVPVANVLVMGMLLQRTVNAIGKLQTQYQEAVAAENSYRYVHRLLKEAANQEEPSSGKRVPTLAGGCRFRDVSFSYGHARVLQHLNLEIPARRLSLLIGPSGAGKTTITDLLLGFYRPDEGEILVDGVPLHELDMRLWRRSIGYVPQELILFHDTVLANITLGDPGLTAAMAEEAMRIAGAADFIARLPNGLLTEVGEKGSKLSGGQRQRIAIARALVHHPQLLILDEVTSALDAETERDICRNIRDIASSVTVLAVSHRPAWIEVAQNVLFVGQYEEEEERRTLLAASPR